MYISEIVSEEIKTLQGVEEIVHCTLESIKLMLLSITYRNQRSSLSSRCGYAFNTTSFGYAFVFSQPIGRGEQKPEELTANIGSYINLSFSQLGF